MPEDPVVPEETSNPADDTTNETTTEPESTNTAQENQSTESSNPPLPADATPTSAENTEATIENALADGNLTTVEREQIADALVEQFGDNPITAEAMAEAGIDYEDLPPDQPVELENGVVLVAEVVAARIV